LVSAVGFASPEEVISAGDDHQLIRWNLNSSESQALPKMADGVFPTDMHWLPVTSGGGGGGGSKKVTGSEVFALGSTDGKLYIMSRAGRVEKVIDGHTGAVLSVRWSYDGSMLLSCGEDGAVKIWSRNGMLRSVLSQNAYPVYSGSWSANSDQVVYSLGKQLVLKSLQPNARPTAWKAHENLVLKVDWNPINNLIVSGAEDCRYKLWDSFGRCVYSSPPISDYPITSVSWSPDGELFLVGSFNSIRLCDRCGWSYSLEKLDCGSVFNVCWSSDSTQAVAAGGNGRVIFCQVVGRRLEWKNIEAVIESEKSISVRNVLDDAKDKLDFRDRIVKASLNWNHLVVCTASQCFVYGTRNWNTPTIFDLKGGCVTMIDMSEKQFLLVDQGSVHVYSYEGRLICSPRYQDMRADTLSPLTCSISPDTVVLADKSDEKAVYAFDTATGRLVGDGKPIMHKSEVAEVALDQSGPATDRKLAIIDRNRDLFITQVRTYGGQRRIVKIGTMVESMCWNSEANMLACLAGSKLLVYYYPAAALQDAALVRRTVFERDAGMEFGKSPQLIGFLGRSITVRKSDGTPVTMSISPYPCTLHSYTSVGKWREAIKLCHFVDDEMLWAVLAAMSIAKRDLDTAETAFAAIAEPDKVEYIQYIRSLPLKEACNAEMLLLSGNVQDAEGLLVQAGLLFRAVMMHLGLYSWERALNLAQKHRVHVDVVLAYRRQFLERVGRKETLPKFKQLSDEQVPSWEEIQKKVESEYKNERERPSGAGGAGTAARRPAK
ncbi:hypothetical protein BOX15_Mlig022764g2, partial [Macrostomum lignano]